MSVLTLACTGPTKSMESSSPSIVGSSLAQTSTTAASTTTIPELLELTAPPDAGMYLRPIEDCRIADVTPGSPDGIPRFGSGFPVPNIAQASFFGARIWVLRVTTNDFSTDEESYALAVNAFDRIVEFFFEQSFGRASLEFVHDRDDVIIALPLSASDYGIDRKSAQQDMSYVLEEVLGHWAVPTDFQDGDQILAILPLVPTRPSIAQGVPISRNLGGRQSGFGMLMTPGNATNWTLIAHEIGHSWLYLEDLYSFGVEGPLENYLDNWDVMAAPGGPNLGFTSWTRWRLGWLEDSQVRCTGSSPIGQYFVANLDQPTSRTKSIVIPTSDHSTFVIETREGYGANAGKSILVVFEVDTSFAHGNGPIRLKGTLRSPQDQLATDFGVIQLEDIDLSGALLSISPA